MVLEFKSMNRSWKRFKNAEGDFEDSIQSLNGTAQEEEDFNAIFSSCIHQMAKSDINQSGDIKLLHTKNSTNDDCDEFVKTTQIHNVSYESPEFQIKSGLSKIKNSYLESNNREHTKDLNLELPF
jgi:hypothetical protein